MAKSLRLQLSLSFLLIFTLLIPTNKAGAQVILTNGPTSFTVTENSFSGITVENTFTSFGTLDVTTQEGIFTEMAVSGYSYTQETGLPKLPVKRKLISIPVGATLQVSVLRSDVKEYKLSDLGITHQLMPAQPPVSKNEKDAVDFKFNKKAYQKNTFFGDEPATAEILGTLRGNRIARLDISPVSYNPVTGIIRVYQKMIVRVNFTGGDVEATSELASRTVSPYFMRLGSMYANELPLMNEREAIVQYPVKMVIVSDPMFQEALQPFIQWKNRKGFNIVEAYTNNPLVGNTTTSIKNYLQSLYNEGTPEDPAPSFVLFVGDVDQIPAFTTGGHVSDLYYCEYTNDYFPEVYYGRFSAGNLSQLQPQIDKTLMYEQYQFPDPAFLGECVMIAGMDGNFGPTHANGQINYGTTYYFNEAHGLLSHTYLYPQSGSSDAQIIQNVSDGVGYANYTAHGSSSGWADPSFSISDIAGLQNDGEYPLMVGNCCQTSMYGINCFAEELLRAPNKGAIGYIGGSNNTYWDEDFYFAVGVRGNINANPVYDGDHLGNYDRLFHDHSETFADWYTTMDQLIFAGNLAVTEGSPGSALYYWQIYNLMGDPSLTPFMHVPPVMLVSHDAFMPLGTTEFTVNAVPYAYVALSVNNVLYGAALADANGIAVVTMNPVSQPCTVQVVVTAQNYQPYFGTVITDSPEGPYIVLEAQSVNDENGNANQKVDYDEEFGFDITLKNVGSEEATNVIATITSACPYIDIISGSAPFGTIAAGSSVNQPMVFTVTSDEWLPDQFTAVFDLQMTDGTNTWISSFNIKLNAPVLEPGDLLIDDSQTLIPNGSIDPGETVLITVPVANTGHCDGNGGTIYFFTDSPYATIENNAWLVGNFYSDSIMTATFQVSIADTTEVGTNIDFFTSASCDPYSVPKNYGLSAGYVVENFETGDFSAFNWQNNSSDPWLITSTTVNNGTYSATSADIGDYGVSEISIEVQVVSSGFISFYRKVSSESGYDYLRFYIDGIEKEKWSGDEDWSQVSYSVTAGLHTFKWAYTKDQSESYYLDAGFIDDIIFPSSSQNAGFTVHSFVYPATPCDNEDVNLFAFTTNSAHASDFLWTPAEYLNYDTIYNPTASILTSTDFTVVATSLFSTDSKTISVIVNAAPAAPIITQVGEKLVSSIAVGNQWYNSTGAIEGATGQEFTPQSTDTYYATVSDQLCESSPSNSIYVIVIGVDKIETGNWFRAYPNPFNNHLNVDFNLTKDSQVRISLINLLGNEVAVLYESTSTDSGMHSMRFQPGELNPGVYFIRYESSGSVKISKIVFQK